MDVNTYFKRAALLEHVRQHLLDECELTLNVFCGKCNHGEASAKDFRTFNSIDVCDEAGRMVRLGWSYRDGKLLCPECSKKQD
jgi:hypothetical protein